MVLQRLATAVGWLSLIGGLVTLLVPFGLLGQATDLAVAIWPRFVAGGLLAMAVGTVVGVRYGRLERYHGHYDEDTGRIEGYPIGRLVDRLQREGVGSDVPPKRYVPERGHLFGGIAGFHGVVLVLLQRVGGLADLFWPAAVVLLSSASLSMLLVDRIARSSYEKYP